MPITVSLGIVVNKRLYLSVLSRNNSQQNIYTYNGQQRYLLISSNSSQQKIIPISRNNSQQKIYTYQ